MCLHEGRGVLVLLAVPEQERVKATAYSHICLFADLVIVHVLDM